MSKKKLKNTFIYFTHTERRVRVRPAQHDGAVPAVVAGAGQAAGAARVGRPVQQRVRVAAPGRRLQRAHVRQVRPQHKRRFAHAQVGIVRI